jgi:hypothetical protein
MQKKSTIAEAQQEFPSTETMLGVLLPEFNVLLSAHTGGKEEIQAQIDLRSFTDQTEAVQQIYCCRGFLESTQKNSGGTFVISVKDENQLKAKYVERIKQLKSLCQFANCDFDSIKVDELVAAQKILLKEYEDEFLKTLQKVTVQLKTVYKMEIKITAAYPYPKVDMKTIVPGSINAVENDLKSTIKNSSGVYLPYKLYSYDLAKLEILAKLTEKVADLQKPLRLSREKTNPEKIKSLQDLITKIIMAEPLRYIELKQKDNKLTSEILEFLKVAEQNSALKTKRRCNFFSPKVTGTEKTIRECIEICEKELARQKEVVDECMKEKLAVKPGSYP